MSGLVTYEGHDEVIIMTEDTEEAGILLYFTNFANGGRDLEDYDRTVHKEAIHISTRLRVN